MLLCKFLFLFFSGQKNNMYILGANMHKFVTVADKLKQINIINFRLIFTKKARFTQNCKFLSFTYLTVIDIVAILNSICFAVLR